jgi:outer membrane protein assembly factor BamD (BamD/ComL family)
MALPSRYILWNLCFVLCAGCRLGGDPAYVDDQAMLQKAHELRADGRHVKAAEIYAEFARQFQSTAPSRSAMAQYLAGEEYFAAGKMDEAVVALERLVRQFPHSPDLTRANARCLEIGKRQLVADDAAGVKTLESLIQRVPYTSIAAEARMALGKYYYNHGRFGEALVEFKLLADGPEFGPLNERARFHAVCSAFWNVRWPVRDLDQLEAARAALASLREDRASSLSAAEAQRVDRYLGTLDAWGAMHHLRMARFYLKQGTVDPALVHLRKVLTDYPEAEHSETAARLILLINEEAQRANP